MKLHIIQHVGFEAPSYINSWALRHGVSTTMTQQWVNPQPLPPVEAFDGLVVMGGPMGVHDEADFPGLVAEKRLSNEAQAAGKKLVGICLGAQLIAHVLGAEVKDNPQVEVGWYPVKKCPNLPPCDTPAFLAHFPQEMMAFHFHKHTFEVPEGAIGFAFSEACPNQGYVLGNQVLGLQFHMESTPHTIAAILNYVPEVAPSEGPYIQSKQAITEKIPYHEPMNACLDALLTGFFQLQPRPKHV